MFARSVALVLLLILPAAHADDQVRSTQEELRRRNIFFGDIDGRRSGEYREAVRRYQVRKGLSASGEEDRDTLRSLGLLPRTPGEPPPKELSWPEEPVLRSDARVDVAVVARQIAEETGVAANVIAPVATGPARLATKKTSSSSAAPAGRATPAAPARSVSQPRLAVGGPELPAQLQKFTANYWRAVGRNRLADELQFYADRVNYYGQSQLDRRIVEQNLRAYYARWPKRDYKLLGPVAYQVVPKRGEIVVSMRIGFSHRNGGKSVQGATENILTINAATADPRIVSIEERRVRR